LARAAAADARQYYRGLKIRPSDVSGIPTKNVVLLIMYVLMQNNRARDWGTEQPALLRDIEPQEMHVHHIFPFNFMAKDKNARAYAEQEELNPSEFRASINDIANLTFLSDASNTRIGDKRPQEYLPEWTTKETRRAHFIPEDSSLWTPKRYGEFLAARRALIAKAATRLLSKLR
jgi:hypothetical protein